MINFLKHSLAMSEQGARGLFKGSLYSLLYYASLMLPMSLIVLLLNDTLPYIESGGPFVFRYGVYAGVIIVSLVLSGFLYYRQYTAVFYTVYGESEAKRLQLGEKLRKLPLSFFGTKDLSDLTNTLMGDVNTLENVQSHAILQMIGSAGSTLLIMLMMLLWDWRMGLALCWVVPIVLLIALCSGRLQKHYAQRHFEVKRQVSDQTQENIEHMTDILANHQADIYLKEYKVLLAKEEKSHRASELVMSLFVSGGQAFLKLGFASTVIVGTLLFERGNLELVKYLFFLIASARVYDPIGGILNNMSYVFSIVGPLGRMRELEESPEMAGNKDVELTSYDITFDHVDFCYQDDTPVLRDVSFTARQGQITALIGPSGCGKSTAAKLAARFYDLQSGRIEIGGRDISTIDPETLMSSISMVFQDVILFDNTVMENIRLGRKEASDEEVEQAAKLAHCDEFIRRLPQGYDTMIGENGARLSGGERLRISIARAILKDAPILLLDEATSSLDVENESKIQESLGVLVRGKTVLVIAHRMRTVEKADKIVALRDGQVVESGPPEELAHADGLYQHLISLQLGKC